MIGISASRVPEPPHSPVMQAFSRGIRRLLTGPGSSIVAAIALIGMWGFPQFSDTFTVFNLSGSEFPLLTRLAKGIGSRRSPRAELDREGSIGHV